ncbi:terminase small subunit [Mycobacterium phage Quesadilla]|uniref:Adenylate kinase n=1 Tax=Mycobacterium phage Quesadilla TaxID=2664226 RepID=A0A5Q2WFF5_9CAUD|nr:terminase small subunit [Mycobacterium phage Quesadilla]QGH75255.1 adenylate kinase [Mycobacterium phage Quesadilla]
MTNRLIYLTGQPGSGKSALMARLTEGFDRIAIAPPETPVAHDQLVRKVPGGYDDGTIEIIGAELGKRRELFGGTDALPSSIIEKAVPWVEDAPYRLILGEGSRLSNKRFLLAGVRGGYEVTLVLLDHPSAEEWRLERSQEIGRTQDASWVQGRLTASRNLATWAEEQALDVMRGHPDELLGSLQELISADG